LHAVCPTGASYKRVEDGIVLVSRTRLHRLRIMCVEPVPTVREMDAEQRKVMKKCRCVDRIYNETFAGT
jgi:nitrate reductase beta subunit